MSALSSSKNSDDNQEEPLEEEGPSSNKKLNELISEEQIELLLRRKKILPYLPWVFGASSLLCFMVAFTGCCLERYYLESITSLAETLLWLTFSSILIYVFGDSITNKVIDKINN